MLVAVSVVHRHQKSRVRNGVLNDFSPEGNRQDSVLNCNTRAAMGRGWWFCLKEKGSPPPEYKVGVFAQAVECQSEYQGDPGTWASGVQEEPPLCAGKEHPLLCGQVRYCRK